MIYGKPEVSERTTSQAKRFRKKIESGKLRQETDNALDAIIRLASYKLHKDGYESLSQKLINEWESQWKGYLTRRDITDHAPLSEWLHEKTDMLEFILGKDIMHALRLDDLITINFCIPVIFSCIDDVSLEEYGFHFIGDGKNGYRGLGPVLSYWGSFFTCVGLTWGTGFMFCAPIAMGVELIVKLGVAPKLNEPLWKHFCHKGDTSCLLGSSSF